jgi:succinyl-diaminopimelate desuccinylase
VTDLLALTEELCRVPSVSRNETALADLVEARLRERAPKLVFERVGDSVVARTDLGHDRRIVLAGHLDTVPPNDNAEPRRDGDTLHGLGTADMKGGLAVLLDLAEMASSEAPRHDTTFVFYEAEEISDEFNGLRRLFAERANLVAGDLAILLEPTGGWVEAGCQGTIHVRATFTGTRAHTARPWMGVNAIHRATPFLERCAAFDAAVVSVDGLDYREALQVVRVDGGVANNVVPDRCEVVINRRYAPSRTLDEAVAEVRALCSDADEVTILNASAAAAPNLVRSSAGPTWRASRATAFRRSTSARVIRSLRTPPASSSSGPTSTDAAPCWVRSFVVREAYVAKMRRLSPLSRRSDCRTLP